MTRTPMLAIGLTAAFAIVASAAQAQTPNTSGQMNRQPTTSAPAQNKTTNKADEKFLTDAIQGDLAEVQMGQLAQQKGGTDGVKEFGATLVKDHGNHADKIRQLGESMGLNLPSEPNATQKSEHAKMSQQSGQEFDRQFAVRMVSEHKRDISKYQMEAKRSGPIADMAKETVPVLQKHLQMAQALNRPAPTTGSR
jgi:putative membrane protein